MKQAYMTGDPYMAFAKSAGAIPKHIHKKHVEYPKHEHVREAFKRCILGVQYGIGVRALAGYVGSTYNQALLLLEQHRKAFPRYWQWSQEVVDEACLEGELRTALGWRLTVGKRYWTKVNTIKNFLIQAHGAELLRLACCIANERGVIICAPVHDAVLIEASQAGIQSAIDTTEASMVEASETLLEGFRLRTESKKILSQADSIKLIKDGRGRDMWERVKGLLKDLPPPGPRAKPRLLLPARFEVVQADDPRFGADWEPQ
jgi:hypothetical protein